MEALVADCCGLAFVDEEDVTVHHVHHSLRDYLFASAVTRKNWLKMT